jgi:hypothetical protein
MPPYRIDGWRRLSSAIGSESGTYAQMMSFEDYYKDYGHSLLASSATEATQEKF